MDEVENAETVASEKIVAVESPAAVSESPPADATSREGGASATQEDVLAEPMPWGDHPNPLLWLHEQMVAGFRRMHKTFG